MICTIADVFYEALDSYSGVEMHTDKEHSKFFMGVKIKKDEDGVTIYNTKKGGLFYREIEGVLPTSVFIAKATVLRVSSVLSLATL